MEDQQGETSTPKRRERQDALEHRRMILAAAKQLFATQGALETSMCEIARAAGVGQGTLYRRFAHKGELCHALIADDIDAFKEHANGLIAGPGAPASALARLDQMLTALIGLTEQHLPLFAVIEGTKPRQRRGKPFRSPFHLWLHERIAGLLGQAMEQDEVAPLDVEYTADAILAVLSPPVLGHQRNDHGYSPERIILGARRLFVEELRRDERA